MKIFISICVVVHLNVFLCSIRPNLTNFKEQLRIEHLFAKKIELTYENPRYTLTSPGFPDKNYPPKLNLWYDVEVKLEDEVQQLSSRILLTFQTFAVQDTFHCYSDYLEIMDPSYRSFSTQYCGVQEGRTILSEGSSVTIHFETDFSIQDNGFSILLELYNTGCSEHVKGVETGIIESRRYPLSYPDHELCVWKIEAPENKKVLLEFEDPFDIRAYEPLCSQDYLAVSLTGDFNTHVRRYCHDRKPVLLYSASNSLLLMFRTDCCFQGKGFKANFTIVDEAKVKPVYSPKISPNCTCGKEYEGDSGIGIIEPRIYGGKVVDPFHRYPWVVALAEEIHNKKYKYFCGGAMINRQYILTAAHCITSRKMSEVRIALSAHDPDTDGLPVKVSKFILHPDYKWYNDNKATRGNNDIALIKLEDPVFFNERINPVCLPTANDLESVGNGAVVTGWGFRPHQDIETSNDLREVEVPIVPNAQCAITYNRVIVDTFLCAGGEKGKDSCQGDSGGSLFQMKGNTWYTVGIVSFGLFTCGREGHPSVYTRVSKYLEWIENNTADAPRCDDGRELPVKPNFNECGISNSDETPRIVGGTKAAPFEFPWMALLTFEGDVIGSGALISPHYVITSASIFDDINQRNLVHLFLGQHRLSGPKNAFSKRYGIRDINIHPKYSLPTPYNNDIAIIRLNVPEEGVPYIYRPICLPRIRDEYSPGLSLKVAGWGSTSNRNRRPQMLSKVDLKVWSDKRCRKRYPGWYTDTMLCAYGRGKDTCHGDDGAPLMRLYSGRYYLAGLASWAKSDRCAIKGAPRVFSAVHKNLEWISKITGLEVF